MSGTDAGSRMHAATSPQQGRAASPGLMDRLRRVTRTLFSPVTRLLVAVGVGADLLTFLGLLMSFASAVAFFEGGFRLGALLLAIAGVFDILDGEVARGGGRSSKFGAFLDSTLDRFADALVLAGIAGYYMLHLLDLVVSPQQAMIEIGRGLEPRTWALVSLTAILALIGSFLISYTRARAEGLGLECRVGWFERPQRMVLLIVAGAFGVGRWMSGALMLFVLLSFVTVGQRVTHVWKKTRGEGLAG